MSNSPGGTLHVLVVVGDGLSTGVAWREIRAYAVERGALVSVSLIEAEGIVRLLSATPAVSSPVDLTIPDSLGTPADTVGDEIVDQIFEATMSVATIERTQVRLYTDEETKAQVTELLKGVSDIQLVVEATSARRRPKPARPTQATAPISLPSTTRSTGGSGSSNANAVRPNRAGARSAVRPSSTQQARRRFRASLRGTVFGCVIAAAATAAGLHLMSGRDVESATITAALTWLLVAVVCAVRHFFPQPDATLTGKARGGRVIFVIAVAVGIYQTLMQLNLGQGCGLECTTLPASAWKAIPIAVVIGTWGAYLANLAIDIQFAGWNTGTRVLAEWLGLPASIVGAASLGSEVLKRLDHLSAAAPGDNLVWSPVASAEGSFLGAVSAVSDFVEPFVSALPGWALSVLPPLATLSALVMFLGARDLQRWSPWALPLTRLLVIVLGLAAGAILINTFGTVVVAMAYVFAVLLVAAIGFIIWLSVA